MIPISQNKEKDPSKGILALTQATQQKVPRSQERKHQQKGKR